MGLFEPAWMTDNPAKADKAVKSVERIDDQDVLIEIVTSAPQDQVRETAFAKLNLSKVDDPSKLVEIAHRVPSRKSTFEVLDCLDDYWLWRYLVEVRDIDLIKGAAERTKDLDGLYLNLRLYGKPLWDTGKVAVLNTIIERTDDPDMLLRIAEDKDHLKLEANTEQGKKSVLNAGKIVKKWMIARCKAFGKAAGDKTLYDAVIMPLYKEKNDLTEASLKYEFRRMWDSELARLDEETDESALRAVYEDTHRKIEHRIAAAKRLRTAFGDNGPYEEFAASCTRKNGHLLLQTAYSEWEYQESICIRCYERGGSREDDGRTKHHGCLFWRDACAGDVPMDCLKRRRKLSNVVEPELAASPSKDDGEDASQALAEDLIKKMHHCEPEERKRLVEENADNQHLMYQLALRAPGSGTRLDAVRHLTDLDSLKEFATYGNQKMSKAALARIAELYPDEIPDPH